MTAVALAPIVWVSRQWWKSLPQQLLSLTLALLDMISMLVDEYMTEPPGKPGKIIDESSQIAMLDLVNDDTPSKPMEDAPDIPQGLVDALQETGLPPADHDQAFLDRFVRFIAPLGRENEWRFAAFSDLREDGTQHLVGLSAHYLVKDLKIEMAVHGEFKIFRGGRMISWSSTQLRPALAVDVTELLEH